MDINASHLLIACLGIVIGITVYSLYRRREQLTPAAVLESVANLPTLTKQMYDDAVIFVQWLEQIGQPDQNGHGGLSNEEKKRRAMEVMQRRWPNADSGMIDSVVEAAVFGVKVLGIKVPQLRITGEAELMDRWLKQQPPSDPF